MTLHDRDRKVVYIVKEFGQLSASQVGRLVFGELRSSTPCVRSLKRLCADGYLARVELRRLVGGSRGGAGQYVYQLGRRGHQLFHEGNWRPSRSANYHQLLMADVYIAARDLERDGLLSIDGMATGEDAMAAIHDLKLYPDMRLDVTVKGQQRKMWIEVDMATEGKRQIKDKLARYWRAVNIAPEDEWPEVPIVVWVACDAERAKELRWIIDQGSDTEAKRYFAVTTLQNLPQLLR